MVRVYGGPYVQEGRYEKWPYLTNGRREFTLSYKTDLTPNMCLCKVEGHMIDAEPMNLIQYTSLSKIDLIVYFI